MKNRIKFIIATLTLALGFFFCINMVSVNVSAEDNADTTTTEEPTTTETTDEAVTQEETEALIAVADTFIDHLKNFKWEEAEALIGWIVSYFIVKFGLDAGVLLSLLVVYLKKSKDTTLYKNAMVKMNAENQKKVNDKMDQFISLVEELKTNNNETLELYKAKLVELTSDTTKEIEADIKAIEAEIK